MLDVHMGVAAVAPTFRLPMPDEQFALLLVGNRVALRRCAYLIRFCKLEIRLMDDPVILGERKA